MKNLSTKSLGVERTEKICVEGLREMKLTYFRTVGLPVQRSLMQYSSP